MFGQKDVVSTYNYDKDLYPSLGFERTILEKLEARVG